MTKFCKDCKFYDADSFIECQLPKEVLEEKSLVTGEHYTNSYEHNASMARNSSNPRECGPEARHFQPSLTYRVVTFFKRVVP